MVTMCLLCSMDGMYRQKWIICCVFFEKMFITSQPPLLFLNFGYDLVKFKVLDIF